MPLHDDEMNMRREKREAQRRKQQAEAKRLRITLILAAGVLAHTKAVFDAVYNPRETQLLQMAKAQGAAAIGGMAMLVWQAADAQTIWFGREFDPQAVAGVVEEALAEMERVFHG